MSEQHLRCDTCKKTYRSRDYDATKTYRCRHCEGALRPVSSTATPNPSGTGAAPSDPMVGRQLGRYKILAKLGEGGMGAVYKAQHVDLQQVRAIKLLPRDKAEKSERARRRFIREARSAAALRHPNIVGVHDIAEEDGLHFIAMEYVEGESVQDIMGRQARLSPKRAGQIIVQAARALAAAHAQNIVHRDVKPANILIDNKGLARVADFGLAKSLDDDASLVTIQGKGGLGTPSFMSPEQCEGMELDGRSDIYALGVTYYYLVTGQLPFQGQTSLEIMRLHRTAPMPDPRSVVPELPDGVARIIAKATAKNPEDRFQSCEEMSAAISAVMAGRGKEVAALSRKPRTAGGEGAAKQALAQSARAAGAGVKVAGQIATPMLRGMLGLFGGAGGAVGGVVRGLANSVWALRKVAVVVAFLGGGAYFGNRIMQDVKVGGGQALSRQKLKELGMAVHMYFQTYNRLPPQGDYPKALLPFSGGKNAFYHPNNTDKPRDGFPDNIDYEFSNVLPRSLVQVRVMAETPVAWEKEVRNDRIMVLYCDGHVEELHEEDFENPNVKAK